MVDGLYNVVANEVRADQQQHRADHNCSTQSFNGMLLSVTARVRNGLTLQGGINSGSQVTDYCGLRAELPELSLALPGHPSPTNPYCHVAPGLVTKVSGVGLYTIPKIDVLIAGTFRSDQGAPLRANYNVPVALVSAALGPAGGRRGNDGPDRPGGSR